MSAPQIVREVYEAHIAHFGEPDTSIRFDSRDMTHDVSGYPDPIDVFIWDADDECDITTFSTIGMAALPLPKARHRAELHFAIRRALTETEKHRCARFLANLAMYSFQIGEPIDWLHRMTNPGQIPFFEAAQCVFFHARFVEEGWDCIATAECDVHLLNVVPITHAERQLGDADAICAALEGIDIFSPR